MKGNEKLIAALNSLLADELTAINQYMVHTELCESWGYGKLHVAIRKQAIDEMRHAEWLIERIIFLDGAPTVSKLNPMKIGKTAAEMISNDYGYELNAIRDYNNAIKLSREVDDQGSLELLTKILKMEEDHADWAEVQLAQIEQMGLENYLVNQVECSAS
jgi:bacterioferritin